MGGCSLELEVLLMIVVAGTACLGRGEGREGLSVRHGKTMYVTGRYVSMSVGSGVPSGRHHLVASRWKDCHSLRCTVSGHTTVAVAKSTLITDLLTYPV